MTSLVFSSCLVSPIPPLRSLSFSLPVSLASSLSFCAQTQHPEHAWSLAHPCRALNAIHTHQGQISLSSMLVVAFKKCSHYYQQQIQMTVSLRLDLMCYVKVLEIHIWPYHRTLHTRTALKGTTTHAHTLISSHTLTYLWKSMRRALTLIKASGNARFYPYPRHYFQILKRNLCPK